MIRRLVDWCVPSWALHLCTVHRNVGPHRHVRYGQAGGPVYTLIEPEGRPGWALADGSILPRPR